MDIQPFREQVQDKQTKQNLLYGTYRPLRRIKDSVLIVEWQNEIFFFKSDLTQEQIQKYLYFMEIGIGVTIVHYSFEQNYILMERGIDLSNFLACPGCNTLQIKAQIWEAALKIRDILHQLQVAHCDIKLQNLIVANDHKGGWRVALIDCQASVSYGGIRCCGTLEENMISQDELNAVANEATDELGFMTIYRHLFE